MRYTTVNGKKFLTLYRRSLQNNGKGLAVI
nr:MAG TPA: hypothetical protein [Caudoviricetes sp.]